MTHSTPQSSPKLDLSYYTIVSIAAPVLIANLAMPLQGAIDVAVVGHFPQAYSLAGLGVASQLWLLILVSFNFLQYASSGLAAQALGRQRATGHFSHELAHILYRSLGLAVLLAALLWVFKSPIIDIGLKLLGAQPTSRQTAKTYIDVRYFGIVFEMMNYAFIGWFAGQGKTKQMMLIQILISVLNIVLTLTLVYFFDMGLRGVALGTVIGYAVGCLTAILLARHHIRQMSRSYWDDDPALLPSSPAKEENITTTRLQDNRAHGSRSDSPFRHRLTDVFTLDKMLSLFSLNKDIFIRTLLLTLSFAWITRLSAQQGDLVMATNAVLLQVLSISAFALDGVAVAAESLTGQAIAHKDSRYFKRAVRNTGITVFWLALTLSIIWLIALPTFLKLMTDLDAVNALALEYRYVAALLPLVGAGAYWLDGIMFGLTAGSRIRQVAIIVAVVFFPLSWVLYEAYGSSYAMPVIWFSVYWLLISRFVVATTVLWRDRHTLSHQATE